RLRRVPPARPRRRRTRDRLPGVPFPPRGGRRDPRGRATIRRAGRVTAAPRAGVEESPDTAGQDAGEIPGGESRRKVEQRGDRLRRSPRRATGKGETVG